MASLDQMEGDTVELAITAVVIVVVVALILALTGSKGLLNWLLSLLGKLEAWFKNFASSQNTAAAESGTELGQYQTPEAPSPSDYCPPGVGVCTGSSMGVTQ